MKGVTISLSILFLLAFTSSVGTAAAIGVDGAPEDCPPSGECCPLVKGNYIDTNAGAWYVCFFQALDITEG